jgi:hypothetical protein
MAVRIATSDPKPSTRPEHRDYDYFYFNKQTPSGGECAALVPHSLRGLVQRGFAFDDAALRYDETLRASVLELDFDRPAVPDPALPADPELGWGDPDHLTALEPTRPATAVAVAERPAAAAPAPLIPNRGLRPATLRKQAAAARAAEHNLDVELLLILDQVCAAFNYASKRIGSVEKPRALEVQKLVVTSAIPWLKQRGIALSDDEEKAMTF